MPISDLKDLSEYQVKSSSAVDHRLYLDYMYATRYFFIASDLGTRCLGYAVITLIEIFFETCKQYAYIILACSKHYAYAVNVLSSEGFPHKLCCFYCIVMMWL